MAEIILITGGCRSGKSQYAERLAAESGGRKLYIATAPVLDSEMKDRVNRHKATALTLVGDYRRRDKSCQSIQHQRKL